MKKHSFNAEEKLKKQADFDLLYKDGRRVFSKNRKLRAVFCTRNEPSPRGIRVAVAVSKKAGIAFWRNRVKRLLREAYRLNKEILGEKITKDKTLLIVISPYSLNRKNNRVLGLADIEPEVVSLLEQIKGCK